MKKLIGLIFLIALNFIIYYYLTENIEINLSYEEIAMTLLASLISIPLFLMLPAFFIYSIKLGVQKVSVPFKKIYLNMYLNVSLAFYGIMIIMAVMVYIKLK